jgi:peptidoglycan/xylan/chitin deacetylase (PgdA/CDA1 family)
MNRRAFLTAAAATAVAACTSHDGRAATPSTDSTTTTTTPTTRFVSAGPTDRNQIALTFHVNGDRTLTTELLGVLKANATPVTAFIVGNWLDANPDLLSRFVDGGHELANHTYTHPTFPRLDPAAMLDEVVRCRDTLQRLSGSGGDFFRPSGTANGTDQPSAAVLDAARTAGYSIVAGYDVDPADYQDPGATAVAKRTTDALHPGAIVSLHFGHRGTVDALPGILASAARRGLRPVTLQTLLA